MILATHQAPDAQRAGYLEAAMGRPLPVDATEEFRRGYHSFRPEDGERFGVPQVVDSITGRMRADGVMPDRRKADRRAPVQGDATGWERALWLLVAFAAGLGAENMAGALRALVGGVWP